MCVLDLLLENVGPVGALIYPGQPRLVEYKTGRKFASHSFPPLSKHAHFFKSFLGILALFCFLTLAFSSVNLFHMFVLLFVTLKIPVHRSGTRDTLKKKLPEPLAR